jgi:hypothetical protein
MRGFTRKLHPGEQVWEAVDRPRAAHDFHHLRREIRYTHLNPSRARFTRDPLEWEWSTHRDFLEATFPSWSGRAVLKQLWHTKAEDFHAYVSGDPSTQVAGTPSATKPPKDAQYPIQQIVRATLLATRASSRLSIASRRLIVLAADAWARTTDEELAAAIGITPRGVAKIRGRKESPGERDALRAIRQVLADPRLMQWREKW